MGGPSLSIHIEKGEDSIGGKGGVVCAGWSGSLGVREALGFVCESRVLVRAEGEI